MSWPMTRIGQFTHVVTKGTTPTKEQGFADSGINYIKAEALNGDSTLDLSGGFFISEDVHQTLKRSILEEGDVLLTIAGANIGKCGIVEERHLPANTNQAVGIMRVDRQQFAPRFLYYWFKQPQTFRYIQGLNAQAAQPNINLSMLRNIEVPVPSISEQKRIAEVLSTYDDLIENDRRRIQLLEQAARLLYKEWFVHLRFPGHEHTRIIDGVPVGWERIPFEDALVLQRGFDLPSHERKDGTVPIYASTGVNGTHNAAKVAGPGVVTGRSGSLGVVHSQVARASLEELKLDYEDFLRQRGQAQWGKENPLRQALIDQRCQTADEVAAWVVGVAKSGEQMPESSTESTKSTPSTELYPELSANAALTLLAVACSLLDRQVERLATDFESEGGFTERLYRIRTAKRKRQGQ